MELLADGEKCTAFSKSARYYQMFRLICGILIDDCSLSRMKGTLFSTRTPLAWLPVDPRLQTMPLATLVWKSTSSRREKPCSRYTITESRHPLHIDFTTFFPLSSGGIYRVVSRYSNCNEPTYSTQSESLRPRDPGKACLLPYFCPCARGI